MYFISITKVEEHASSIWAPYVRGLVTRSDILQRSRPIKARGLFGASLSVFG